jgi:uncharacterized repeat protein (TIGR02543 family)
LNSGTLHSGAPSSFSISQLPLTLPTPIRNGFRFQGWFESSSFTGNPITQIPSNTTSNKVYFARWLANESFQEKIVKTDLGYAHSSVISTNGQVFTWGANNNGTLGDGTNFRKLVPNEISSKFYLSK